LAFHAHPLADDGLTGHPIRLTVNDHQAIGAPSDEAIPATGFAGARHRAKYAMPDG
jgi:hypothetical protein